MCRFAVIVQTKHFANIGVNRLQVSLLGTEADDAFRTMQNDGVSRKFDMVVVDSLLRCGSNVSYAEDVLLKSFLPAGIHFAVVEDNVCSLTLTYEEAAAYFKKKRNAYIGGVLYSRTRAEQAQGYLSVHDEKYGYLLNEERKGFVIDEEVVPIIRKIFHMVADDKKLFREVADYLNENKIDSPMMHLVRVSQKKRGEVKSHWSPGSVKRVIDNTAYIGYWYSTGCLMISTHPVRWMNTLLSPIISLPIILKHGQRQMHIRSLSLMTGRKRMKHGSVQ